MEKKNNVKFENKIALFGNPIKHSLSPKIHQFFSKEIKIKYLYVPILCKQSNFSKDLFSFFHNGGFGANITIPFKKDAYFFSNQVSLVSKISQTVNTFSKISGSNAILGDNTDGLGLIYDLNRLNFIKRSRKVLLLGAGGAANSIVYNLLSEKCSVVVLNRTIENALDLVKRFKNFGDISLFQKKKKYNSFDLIINATASSLQDLVPSFPLYLVNSETCCYDLFYTKNKKKMTSFLSLCKKLGSNFCSDGIGMLVAQAAYAVLSWFGIMPNILKTINYLQKINY